MEDIDVIKMYKAGHSLEFIYRKYWEDIKKQPFCSGFRLEDAKAFCEPVIFDYVKSIFGTVKFKK